MRTIQDIFKYVYISLKEYPPPQMVMINFKSNDHKLTGLFYRACAKILNVTVADLISSLSKSSLSIANLILTNDDIQYLFDNHILPTIDINLINTKV